MKLKKMFRVVGLTAAAAVFVCAFAGCNGSGGGTTGGKDIDVISIWSNDTHSKTVYDEIINEYNETTGKEKGIRIDYIIKAGDSGSTSIELALQTGDAPDLFGGDMQKFAELGYIAALEDLPGGQELVDTHKDIIRREVNTYKDKTYCLPAYATTRGLLYNKDMFKAAGLVDEKGEPTPPKTYDELREYAKKLTNPEKKQYGIILPMKWSSWFAGDLVALMQSSSGNTGYDFTKGTYDYSELVPIMKMYLGIKEDGSYYPAPESLDNDAARAYFADGNIGMKFGFSFDVGVLNDQFPAKIDWGVAELPVEDINNRYLQRMTQSKSYLVNAESVKDEKKAKKIVEVLKFFQSDEFTSRIYQAGVAIPVRASAIEGIKLENPPKGWEDFANMVKISIIDEITPSPVLEGKQELKDRFVNDVWSGKKTPEQIVEEYNKDINEGLELFYKNNPDKEKSYYISPDWDAKR